VGQGGATLASPRPGHEQEPHGIQSASTGPVPWVSNLHPTATPSLPDTGPTHNPHSVDDYMLETPSSEARVKG